MNQPRPERPKSNALVFSLAIVLCVGLLVVLTVLSFGFFFWVFAITLCIALVGLLHYALWGQNLTDQVTEERESFLRQQAREMEREQGWRE